MAEPTVGGALRAAVEAVHAPKFVIRPLPPLVVSYEPADRHFAALALIERLTAGDTREE